MRKRSLWSQHICYTLIPLPTLPEVEREDARHVFPWYSSHLAHSPTEQWELSTSSWDRSKWKSIGKMVAGCKGGWLYPQICWFLYGGSLSSVCLGVSCDTQRMLWGHGSSKAHRGTSAAHPYQWPWAHFLSTLLATQPASGVLHVLGVLRSRFLHVWHSLQKKLIKWWDSSSYTNQKQEGKRFAGADLPWISLCSSAFPPGTSVSLPIPKVNLLIIFLQSHTVTVVFLFFFPPKLPCFL